MFLDKSTCQVDFFAEQLYLFETMEPEQVKELLAECDRRVILPEQEVCTFRNKVDYITVLEPLYTDYQTVQGTCVFFISADTIQKMVHNQLEKYDAVFQAADRSGRVLYCSDKSLCKKLADGGANGYFTSVHVSPASGWTFTAYVPRNQQFLKKINRMNRELLFITMIELIVASILISVLMRVNYSPIRRLGEKASSILRGPAPKGELETISSTLDYLSDRNQYLAEELRNSAAAIKSSRLHRLLTGHYMSREDFNLDVQDLNLGYQNDWFFVAVVQVHGKPEDYDAFALHLHELLSGSMECFYTFPPEPDRIILINGIKKERTKQVKNLLEEMRLSVKEEFRLELTVGVGGIYNGTLSIPTSYLEAGSALDYRFVNGNGKTILYQDLLAGENASISYPKRQFEQLRDAVVRGDKEAVSAGVEALIEYIQKKNLPLFVARGICFDILSLFAEESSSFYYNLPYAGDMSAITRLDTVADVIGLIQKLSAQLTVKPEVLPKQNSDILLENIMEYIKNNCLRCDFSIQETAEHFQMLLPNLSQFFKEKTGQNILDYSTDFRMKKAKALMEDEKLTLKEIGQQVGYYNVSSFIRRFKQIQGMTPGDYRKNKKTDSV